MLKRYAMYNLTTTTHRVSLLIVLLTFFYPFISHATDTKSLKEILSKCDQSRGNLQGVSWKVSLIAKENSKISSRKIFVRARGFDIIAKTISPSHHKGDTLIMINGNMWFFKNGLSKPVPISKRQRLLGLATNSDIASTNYAEDYKIEHVTSSKFNNNPCYVFELKAKKKGASYSNIKYWVDKKRLVGVKSEFYTIGSKLLKSAVFEYKHQVITEDGSTMRPFISRMTIYDELKPGYTTELLFSEPVLKPIPPSVFNLNLIGK